MEGLNERWFMKRSTCRRILLSRCNHTHVHTAQSDDDDRLSDNITTLRITTTFTIFSPSLTLILDDRLSYSSLFGTRLVTIYYWWRDRRTTCIYGWKRHCIMIPREEGFHVALFVCGAGQWAGLKLDKWRYVVRYPSWDEI